MKNVMIIDGALNCAYDIFQFKDEEFSVVFPGDGQDIAFIDEVEGRDLDSSFFDEIWKRPLRKSKVHGIDGILYYDLDGKKEFYPNRKDADLDYTGRGFSVEKLK